MAQFINNLSIKTKMMLVIMFSSVVLLFIIGSIVLVAEIYLIRAAQTQELRLLANTLSANSQQPLVLGQYSKIESLLASLLQQKNIHAAYVFDKKGVPVAEYLKQQDSQFVLQSLQNDFREKHKTFWSTSTTERQLSSKNHFSLFSPIHYEGKQIGTLYLLSDLTRLYGHLSGVAFAITLAFLLLISLSWLLAGRLQKPISIPLQQLASLMENISQAKDYSIRAEKVGHDEIGTLVDGFNRMLGQIELHQVYLAEHQIYLERIVSDRTAELRTAVTGLELASQQADAANEAKSHFLSRMTHELRTPLIGVLGMNELLQRTSLSEQQQELVETVQKSGEQLLHLISDVLDFSRIEAGKLSLELTEFELPQLLEDVVELLSPQADEKNLSLRVKIASNSCWKVRADEIRLRQILMNLIGNAIKFTSNGSITVSLNCSQSSDNSGTFVLAVADTGRGMMAEDMRQIFDVFYQTGSSGESSGAGLGLAIVKQLVDLMNGRIDLTSTPGQGSKFQVTVELILVEKPLHLQEIN
ncbi:MAG: ATP-binding protein [Thermodesulfobacteriota bacterium]|nr:ATP-binding protein [Thermodesulfobacteriota bacterium]